MATRVSASGPGGDIRARVPPLWGRAHAVPVVPSQSISTCKLRMNETSVHIISPGSEVCSSCGSAQPVGSYAPVMETLLLNWSNTSFSKQASAKLFFTGAKHPLKPRGVKPATHRGWRRTEAEEPVEGQTRRGLSSEAFEPPLTVAAAF